MTDTTVLGYITPDDETPQDIELEDIVQGAVAGITGLLGKFVRPSFSTVVANQPEHDVNWVAFKIVTGPADNDAFINHQPSLLVNGDSTVYRDEHLLLTLSFYGPDGSKMLRRWSEGLAVDQNRWVLQDHGIKLIGQSSPVNLPALLKDRWVRRIDLTTTFARRVATKYPIRTISSANVELDNEYYVTHISTTP